jgi:hypothetical protein
MLLGFLLVLGLIIWEASYPLRIISRITPGMPVDKAVALIGSAPWKTQSVSEFCHDHKQGMLLGACKALPAAGAEKVLLWREGIDTIIVVGINPAGQVVLVDNGDI